MMSYSEINDFCKSFNKDSYNRYQIGSNKQQIILTLEFLNKIGLSKNRIDKIINFIAFYQQDTLNLPLFLELLSESICFLTEVDMDEILKIVKSVHALYKTPELNITLEEYIHAQKRNRIKKIFAYKYQNRNMHDETVFKYLNDLRLSAAVALNRKEYNEFMNCVENLFQSQITYSPLTSMKIYGKLRGSIKGLSKLFWDLVIGQEYIVMLCKCNIDLHSIYQENIYSLKTNNKNKGKQIQLDLFTYQDEMKEEALNADLQNIKVFQISTLYNSKEVPFFTHEKELFTYYERLLKMKNDLIVLPKLKSEIKPRYKYETN